MEYGDDESFQFDTFPFPCHSGRHPKTIKYRCPKRRKENMNTDKAYAEKVALEYAAKETCKVVALKKLDRKAKMGALIFGYSFGIVMTLLLGVGMCFSLQVVAIFGKTSLATSSGSSGSSGCRSTTSSIKRSWPKASKNTEATSSL